MGLSCIKSWTASTLSKEGGDCTQLSPSHEAYLFTAGRHTEVDKWMKTFGQVMWVPFTGGVFGQTLESTLQYEKRYGERPTPMIVEQCVNYIRNQGLQEVGLFRLPGQARMVKDLQEAFDAGEKPSFDSTIDVHTVASLLKLYLWKLPEPVVPFSKYSEFLLCGKMLTEDKEKGMQELKKQLSELPSANINLLQYMCRFLDEVQFYSNLNKMGVQNLVTVFGPNILRPKVEDPLLLSSGEIWVQQLMSVMISEHGKLFPLPSVSHSSLAGHNEFQTYSFQNVTKEKHKKHQFSKTHISSLSLPLTVTTNAAQTGSEKNAAHNSYLDKSVPVPRCESDCKKRTEEEANRKAVPSEDVRQCLSDNYCSELAYKLEASPHFNLEESKAEIRSTLQQNGLFPTISKASSSCDEKQRISTPGENTVAYTRENRLPMYDNAEIDPVLISEDMNSVDSISWSSCSCETMLEDDLRSHQSSRASCHEEDLDGTTGIQNNLGHSALIKNSNSEVFSSATDFPANIRSPQSLLVGLKQQISKQKADYEAKIKSLEQQNDNLELEIQDLHSNLEHQKKWHGIVEIKMRNAERAKEDAERRNEMLQQEMEEFFVTFRNLTNEGKKRGQSF
ncbi:rho GTPase-activating protein 24 [Microcaecilia unicolor]|uniref:Rho GTPase-activating protein 24-like n=1 Tax=Microcaecilia unicolor TaxID=1415580 RepID=A0A6P7Z0K5_9AMPH|nr:rho GTPase-activating protein 24-like [Microcaecilia unicolor]